MSEPLKRREGQSSGEDYKSFKVEEFEASFPEALSVTMQNKDGKLLRFR